MGTLGARVRQLRQERGLSINDLARAAGIAYSTVGNIEDGRQEPVVSTLERLARVLEVPLAELHGAASSNGHAPPPAEDDRTLYDQCLDAWRKAQHGGGEINNIRFVAWVCREARAGRL